MWCCPIVGSQFFDDRQKNGPTCCTVSVLTPRRTPESDSPNPWGSIEHRLRTTVLEGVLDEGTIDRTRVQSQNMNVITASNDSEDNTNVGTVFAW